LHYNFIYNYENLAADKKRACASGPSPDELGSEEGQRNVKGIRRFPEKRDQEDKPVKSSAAHGKDQ